MAASILQGDQMGQKELTVLSHRDPLHDWPAWLVSIMIWLDIGAQSNAITVVHTCLFKIFLPEKCLLKIMEQSIGYDDLRVTVLK